MPEPLDAALAALRPLLLDGDRLVRAVAAGRRRGQAAPLARAELRPVDLAAGTRLQMVTTEAATEGSAGPPPAPVTRNVPWPDAGARVDELLALPFSNWHVETREQVVQLRVTKRGEAQVHRAAAVPAGNAAPRRSHDRAKRHLLDPDDPVLAGADAAKRRQVEALLRQLALVAPRAAQAARAEGRPLGVVDLGCGSAHLTLAAARWLAAEHGPVRVTGVDVREDVLATAAAAAERAGLRGAGVEVAFVRSAVLDADVDHPVDLVLALHACDTATDEALARAARWQAPVVLAAPCCHHDVQRQLKAAPEPPPGWSAVLRQPILRERLGDVLTDAMRASQLRLLGYRVDVVEFVDSRHTPRNALLRAVRTGAPPTAEQRAEHERLRQDWAVVPALDRLLDD